MYVRANSSDYIIIVIFVAEFCITRTSGVVGETVASEGTQMEREANKTGNVTGAV